MGRPKTYSTEEERKAARIESSRRSRAKDGPKRPIRPKASSDEERKARHREQKHEYRRRAKARSRLERLAELPPGDVPDRMDTQPRPETVVDDRPDHMPRSTRTEEQRQKAREAKDRWLARKEAGLVRPHRKFSSDEERKEHQRAYMREYCRDWVRRNPDKIKATREKTLARLREGRPARVPMSPEERAAKRRAYKAAHAREYVRKPAATKPEKPPKLKVGRRKGDRYVDNSELLAEVVLSRAAGELTPRAWEMLMLISEEAAKKLYYADPRDRQDCVQQARIEMFKYWRGFDPAKSTNAFAYFTEMAKNGYARAWEVLHPKKYKGTLRMDAHPDSFYNI